MRSRFLAGCALCLAVSSFASAPCRGAEERIEIVIDTEAIEGFVKGVLPEAVEMPTTEEWNNFWNELLALLNGESVEDLAAFKPVAALLVAYLAENPDLRNEADWLKQRMDFLDAAEAVVRETPPPPPEGAPDRPVTPPPVEPPRPPPVAPDVPQPGSAAPVPVPAERPRALTVQSDALWTKQLAKRPPPANADRFIPRLKAVFREEGVPPELVWIAEVESSLNPDAKSPTGAVGLFQFMPATARRFGLRTGLFDERKDPEKSARAAAQYLKLLHRRFGSWRLALAAYNAGEGRVGRTLESRNGKSFDDIAEHLPVETRMYVPKVMALVALRENMDPARLPPPSAD